MHFFLGLGIIAFLLVYFPRVALVMVALLLIFGGTLIVADQHHWP